MSLSFFLLSDFGNTDPYVAQMKGVLHTLAPQHPIYDITHNISPHNIAQAAFYLDATIDHLPPYSVTICIIDPGVGTSRDLLCMEINDRIVLAPDNGCLSFLKKRYPNEPVFRISQDNLPLDYTSHSCTFHGRTMFSPLAADIAKHIGQLPSYIACSSPEPFSKNSTPDCRLESFPPQPSRGNSIISAYMKQNNHPAMYSIVTLPETMTKLDNNVIVTHALHIDTFGNIILGLRSNEWHKRIEHAGELTLYTQTTRTLKLISAYQQLTPEQMGIICGSQGYLELACYMCSAADVLNIQLGDTVKIVCSIPLEI